MGGAANGLLLLDAMLLFAVTYRLGWAVNAEIGLMPPHLAAILPGLKRMYYAAILLAFCSCLAIAGHLIALNVAGSDPWWTRVAMGAALALAAVGVWFAVVAYRPFR